MSSLSIFISTGYPQGLNCSANVTVGIESEGGSDSVLIKIEFQIEAEKRREKRILWDMYHSVKYPEGGRIMRDEDKGSYMFDWRGDHPFTNYLALYSHLISLGYTVDVSPLEFRCVDGSLYSTYLLLDPEAEFSMSEIRKIKHDVEKLGVNLLVVADWYDEMKVAKNLEQNSSNILARDETHTLTSGSSVPSLNSLLSSYFMEFSTGDAYSGSISMNSHTADYMLGTAITRFPQGGYLMTEYLQSWRSKKNQDVPFLGLYDDTERGYMKGRIALFGDSSCLDTDMTSKDCLWVVEPVMSFLEFGEVDANFFPANSKLPHDYDMHKEMKLRIPRLIRPSSNESSCPLLPLDTDQVYIHNKSLIKLQTWTSSPEQAKARETKWVVYLERIVFIGFGLLALIVWVSGRARRREEVLPTTDRGRRGKEERSLVAAKRSKTSLNNLPINVVL